MQPCVLSPPSEAVPRRASKDSRASSGSDPSLGCYNINRNNMDIDVKNKTGELV